MNSHSSSNEDSTKQPSRISFWPDIPCSARSPHIVLPDLHWCTHLNHNGGSICVEKRHKLTVAAHSYEKLSSMLAQDYWRLKKPQWTSSNMKIFKLLHDSLFFSGAKVIKTLHLALHLTDFACIRPNSAESDNRLHKFQQLYKVSCSITDVHLAEKWKALMNRYCCEGMIVESPSTTIRDDVPHPHRTFS